MFKALKISILIGLVVAGSVLAAEAPPANPSWGPECTPAQKNFFVRIECLFDLGVNAVGNLITPNNSKQQSPTLFPPQSPSQITAALRQAAQQVEALSVQSRSAGEVLNALSAAYNKAAPAARLGLLSTIQASAMQRQQVMINLAKQSPEMFLQNVLPQSAAAQIPSAAQQYIEKSATVTGQLEVLHFDDFKNNKSSEQYTLISNGQRLTFYPAGGEPGIVSGAQVTVKGYQTSNVIVAPIANNTFSVSNVPPLQSVGEQKVAVLLVNFLDSGQAAVTPDQIKEVLFDGGSQFQKFYQENSYNQVHWSGDVYGPYTLQRNMGCSGYGSWPSEEEVAQLIASNHINLAGYGRVLVVPNHDCASGGFSSIGQASLSVGGNTYQVSLSWVGGAAISFVQEGYWSTSTLPFTGFDYVAAHELGHALGVMHANGWSCGAGEVLYGACQHVEYGNFYDTMGYGGYSLDFNADLKDQLGWLDASSSISISQTGNYELTPLETGSGFRAARITPSSTTTPAFYLEYRQPVGFDAGLSVTSGTDSTAGLLVNWNFPQNSFSGSRLLDMQPQGQDWFSDVGKVSLNAGQEFDDPGDGVTIGPVTGVTPSSIKFHATMYMPECLPNVPFFQLNSANTLFALPSSQLYTYSTVQDLNSPTCQAANYHIDVSAPPGWTYVNNYPSNFQLSYGQSNFGSATINVPASAAAGAYPITVTVTDLGSGLKNSQTIYVDVEQPYLTAALSSSTPATSTIISGQKGVFLGQFVLETGSQYVYVNTLDFSLSNYPTGQNPFTEISVYDAASGGLIGTLGNLATSTFFYVIPINPTTPALPPDTSMLVNLIADMDPAAHVSGQFLNAILEQVDIGSYFNSLIAGLPVYGNAVVMADTVAPPNLSAYPIVTGSTGGVTSTVFALQWNSAGSEVDGYELWLWHERPHQAPGPGADTGMSNSPSQQNGGNQYNLLSIFSATTTAAQYTIPPGSTDIYHYKIRSFAGTASGKVYSDFSDPITVDATRIFLPQSSITGQKGVAQQIKVPTLDLENLNVVPASGEQIKITPQASANGYLIFNLDSPISIAHQIEVNFLKGGLLQSQTFNLAP